MVLKKVKSVFPRVLAVLSFQKQQQDTLSLYNITDLPVEMFALQALLFALIGSHNGKS
jgi:hypothetical protein